MMPGDPVVNLLGDEALHNDPEMIEKLRAEFGLDRPMHIQYTDYLRSLSRLDLGYSIHKSHSVADSWLTGSSGLLCWYFRQS